MRPADSATSAKREDLLAALAVAAFFGLGLVHLGRYPIAHEDEIWQTAPGLAFFTTGRFGTPLFSGFFGMERHYYGFMPLVSLLAGASLKLFGLSLAAARLAPLLLATLTLALTYALGRRLFSPTHGLLAVGILATWPVVIPLPHLVTGIPLFDLARHLRNDLAVAAFGLAALFVVIPAPRDEAPRRGRLFAAGLLAGLATLGHVYGAAWLAALLLVLALHLRRGVFRSAPWIGAGFFLALAPYLAFVASGWPDYLLQNRNYASRVALSDPGFYLRNLLHEPQRYRFLADAAVRGGLAPWLFGAAIAAGVSSLARRDRVLLPSLATVAGLFALLLEPKNFTYMATLWPLLALTAACGLRAPWSSGSRPVRLATALLFVTASATGLLSLSRFVVRGHETTPYAVFERRLAAALPPGSRVLGHQVYWLGLVREFPDYRSIGVPVFLSNPRFVAERMTFGEAAEALPPDIVLLDQRMLEFLANASNRAHEFHRLAVEIRDYLAARHAHLTSVLEDTSYGRTEIWALPRS